MRRLAPVGFALLSGAAAFLLFSHCDKGGSKEASTAASTNTAQSGTVAVDTNPLATSYPDGLAVNAFQASDEATTTQSGTVAITYSSESALRLAEPALSGPQSQTPVSEPKDDAHQCFATYADALAERGQEERHEPKVKKGVRSRASEARERIGGKVQDCLSDDVSENLATIKKELRRASQSLDGYGDCFLPDWGLVQGFYPQSNDVCTVGYARNQLRKLGAYVDFTKGLTESMLCQAFKDGQLKVALQEGEKADLTEALKKVLGRPEGPLVPIKSATILRESQAGVSIYTTDIVVAPPDENGAPSIGDLRLVIAHKPTDDNNTAYSGTLRIWHGALLRAVGGPLPSKGLSALSLEYARSQDSVGDRIKYELRSALFAAGTNAFDSDGLVDFNVLGLNADNSQLQSMNVIAYDGYPELDVAKLSYWVNFGASYNEPARGMVFDTKRVDGKVKGCAVAGAVVALSEDDDTGASQAQGTSVRGAIKDGYALLPTGHFRPFLCGEELGGEMWLQCFERDANGAFVPDPALIDDVANGYDFVTSSVIEEKVPELADVPRPPRYNPSRAAPPQGAPQGKFMPKAPGSSPTPTPAPTGTSAPTASAVPTSSSTATMTTTAPTQPPAGGSPPPPPPAP